MPGAQGGREARRRLRLLAGDLPEAAPPGLLVRCSAGSHTVPRRAPAPRARPQRRPAQGGGGAPGGRRCVIAARHAAAGVAWMAFALPDARARRAGLPHPTRGPLGPPLAAPCQVIIIVGETGSGKTTQIPQVRRAVPCRAPAACRLCTPLGGAAVCCGGQSRGVQRSGGASHARCAAPRRAAPAAAQEPPAARGSPPLLASNPGTARAAASTVLPCASPSGTAVPVRGRLRQAGQDRVHAAAVRVAPSAALAEGGRRRVAAPLPPPALCSPPAVLSYARLLPRAARSPAGAWRP